MDSSPLGTLPILTILFFVAFILCLAYIILYRLKIKVTPNIDQLKIIPVPIFWTEGNKIKGNSYFNNLFGEEILNKESHTSKTLLQLMTLSNTTNMRQVGSINWLSKNGPKSANINCYPIDKKNTIGIAEDYTSLERLQKHLSELLESQNLIFEYIGSGIAIFNLETRLQSFNSHFLEILKLDKKFLSSNPTFEMLLHELAGKRMLPDYDNLKDYLKARLDFFVNIITPTYEKVYLPEGKSLKIVYAPHPSGGLIMVVEDISAQVNLERSFHLASAAHTDTLHAIRESAFMFGSNGKLKFMNRSACKMLTLENDDKCKNLHIKNILKIIKDSLGVFSSDEINAKWINYITNLKPHYERFDLDDGRRFDVRSRPIVDGNCLLIFEDLTNERKIQQSLEERAKTLLEADAIKRRFLANISYHFRAPLTSIIGFSSLLRRSFDKNKTAANKGTAEYTNAILNSANSLALMIDTVTDYAAAKAGFLTLSLKQLPLAPLIRESFKDIASDIKNKQITVKHSLDENIVVNVDRKKFKRSIAILLRDAIPHTSPNSELKITLSTAKDSDCVHIIFNLTPAPNHEKYFKINKGKLTQNNVNLGIGFELAQVMVDLHAGIFNMSGDSKSALIQISLPIQLPPPQTEPANQLK